MLRTDIPTRGGTVNALIGPPLRYSRQFFVPYLRRQTRRFQIPLNKDAVTEILSWKICLSVNQSINQLINPSIYLAIHLSE